MESDISNRTLASLLVIAIVVVIATTMITISKMQASNNVVTGFATSQQGTATVQINSSLSILLTSTTVDFGSCAPAGNTLTLESNASATPTSCTGGTYPGQMTLLNNGNVNATINISSDVNATQLLNPSQAGGEEFYFAGYDGSSACAGTLTSTWTSFAAASTPYALCTKLLTGKSMGIYYKLVVPPTAQSGTHTATITFTAATA